MLVTNHVLSGSVIGAVVRRPAAAFALGVASHFALDATPHWGKFDGGPAYLFDVLPLGGCEQFRPYPAGDAAARDGRSGDDNGIRNSARRTQRPGNGAPVPRANGYRLIFEPQSTNSFLA